MMVIIAFIFTTATMSLSQIDTLPWGAKLSRSYMNNYSNSITVPHHEEEVDDSFSDSQVYLSMSNTKRSGETSMHCIPFRGFLKDDARFLKFSLAINDSALMGDIKSDPEAKLSWIMNKTNEYYNFTGKFYIASAPIQITRFPPPKIIEVDSAEEYWEQQRIGEWRRLHPSVRATFTWPSRAAVPKASDISFSCRSLSDSETSVVHDIALDNFCLLLYKVTFVEHFEFSCFPPKRTIYSFSARENIWEVQSANP